jgi:hypothetical protein
MDVKKLLNATESARYLGVSRTAFFPIQKEFNLKSVAKVGNVSLYAKSDLKGVKK